MRTIYYHFVLDASKSMVEHREMLTLFVYKHFRKLAKCFRAREDERIEISYCMFNTSFRFFRFDETKKTRLEDLQKQFIPDNLSAIYDALGINIEHLNDVIEKQCVKYENQVYFILLSDGHENGSSIFTPMEVAEQIGCFQQKNWKFIFIGSRMDIAAPEEILELSDFRHYEIKKNELKGSFERIESIICR